MSKPSQRCASACEEGVDLRVLGDVERQRDVAAELGGHLSTRLLELVVLIAERELGAFAAHRLRDAPRDRAIAREPDDDGPFAGEEAHQPLCSVTSTNIFEPLARLQVLVAGARVPLDELVDA